MAGLLLETAFSSLLPGSKPSSGNIGFGIYRKLAASNGPRRLLEATANSYFPNESSSSLLAHSLLGEGLPLLLKGNRLYSP